MNCIDPIADLLTRVRNAQKAKHDIVSVPASKIKISIANILKNEGFIKNFKCIRDKKQGILKIALKYDFDGEKVINQLIRISRPSRRIYVTVDKLPKVRNGLGVGIISSSRGIVTDREARKLNVGGEYLCSIF